MLAAVAFKLFTSMMRDTREGFALKSGKVVMRLPETMSCWI